MDLLCSKVKSSTGSSCTASTDLTLRHEEQGPPERGLGNTKQAGSGTPLMQTSSLLSEPTRRWISPQPLSSANISALSPTQLSYTGEHSRFAHSLQAKLAGVMAPMD